MVRNEGRGDNRHATASRIGAVLFLIVIAGANSLLFYYVIWPEFSPNDPFSTLLFFISGGAHLIYLFIPWFVIDVVGGTIGTGGEDMSKYDTNLGGDTAGFFMRLCIVVGALSIVVVGMLSLLRDQIPDEPPPAVSITRANCLYAGGVPVMEAGGLICGFPEKQPSAGGGTQ